MRKQSTILSILCLLIAVPATMAPAQAQEPGSQLFHVTDIQVKPAMAQKYEAAVRRQIELGYPEVFYGSRTDDYHYYTVMPIARYAGIDTLLSKEEVWMAKAGKERRAGQVIRPARHPGEAQSILQYFPPPPSRAMNR